MRANSRPYTFDRVVRMLIGLAILIFSFFLINRLSSALLPFLIAWLLAYLLQPIVRFFQYKLRLKNMFLSIACTLVLVFGCVTGLVWFLAPIVSNEISKLFQLIVLYTKGLNVNTFLPIAWQNEIRNYLSHINIQSILRDQNIMAVVKKLTPEVWNLINSSLDFVLGLTVVIIVLLYLVLILLNYDKLATGLFKIVPPNYRTLVTEIIQDIESGMNRYFRGQALISLIVGVLFVIGFSIIQLPLAIVLGVFIGVINMVPYLKVVGVIPAVTMGLLRSVETGQSLGSVLIGIVIVFVLIQLIEDLILTPNIMGKVTGLNPAIILLSLSVWGSLMGIVGMIIALPMTTLIMSYYKRYVLNEGKKEQVKRIEKDDITSMDVEV
ncbi:MAG: AI-2E family transporter [Bacteroidota bacterium]|nr:AI-2E family transporter [Bacteroidota bacterium]